MLAMIVVTGLIVAGSAVMVVLSGRGGAGNHAGHGGADTKINRGVLTPDEGLEGLVIPEFSLIDQSGQPLDHSVFDGRVTILDFSFTNCPFVCPGMTAAMISLQSDLVGTGVRFASISVDPAHDTPEVLRAHCEELGVDSTRWAWMTGDEKEIRKIVAESLKFEIQDDPSKTITLKDGSQMSNIMHPSRLFLIGPDRKLLSLYAFNDLQAMEALKARAMECVAIAGRR